MALEDIGDGDDALLCMTNLTPCCQSPNEEKWVFLNGTGVFPSWDFNRTRGRMLVRLNHGRVGVEGIYCCEITDSTNVTQTIYIGVYTANTVQSKSYSTAYMLPKSVYERVSSFHLFMPCERAWLD